MRFKVPKNDQQTAPYARADFGLEAVIRNPLGVGEVAAAAQLAERTKFQSDVFSRRSKPSSRSLSVGQQSSTLRLLHLSARKSRHRRIKTGRHKPVIPAVTFLTPLSGHHPPPELRIDMSCFHTRIPAGTIPSHASARLPYA